MKIIEVPKNILLIDDKIKKIDFFPKTYIIVDSDRNVYFGSSFINNIDSDDIWCLEWEKDDLKLEVCRAFEKAMADEGRKDRYENLAKEINRWVKEWFSKEEQGCLGIDDKEYRCIKEEIFDKPPVYDFCKTKRGEKKKREKEEEEKDEKEKVRLF